MEGAGMGRSNGGPAPDCSTYEVITMELSLGVDQMIFDPQQIIVINSLDPPAE